MLNLEQIVAFMRQLLGMPAQPQHLYIPIEEERTAPVRRRRFED